jgi:hypothetical protein
VEQSDCIYSSEICHNGICVSRNGLTEQTTETESQVENESFTPTAVDNPGIVDSEKSTDAPMDTQADTGGESPPSTAEDTATQISATESDSGDPDESDTMLFSVPTDESEPPPSDAGKDNPAYSDSENDTADTNGFVETGENGNSETDSIPDSATVTDSNSVSDADTDTDTDSDNDTDANADLEADTDSGADTNTDTDSETDTGTGTITDIDNPTDFSTDVWQDTDVDSGTASDSETTTDSDPGSTSADTESELISETLLAVSDTHIRADLNSRMDDNYGCDRKMTVARGRDDLGAAGATAAFIRFEIPEHSRPVDNANLVLTVNYLERHTPVTAMTLGVFRIVPSDDNRTPWEEGNGSETSNWPDSCVFVDGAMGVTWEGGTEINTARPDISQYEYASYIIEATDYLEFGDTIELDVTALVNEWINSDPDKNQGLAILVTDRGESFHAIEFGTREGETHVYFNTKDNRDLPRIQGPRLRLERWQ